VSDLPFALATPGARDLLARVIDLEGKIPRALEALGPLADRDVVLCDADAGLRARQLAALAARVTALVPQQRLAEARRAFGSTRRRVPITVAAGTSQATGLPAGFADAIVSLWAGFRGGTDEEVAEADRILRPGGRLLVLHDYARDDVSRFAGETAVAEAVEWSHRHGWFLTHGFKVRVIHAWWTFADLADARAVLTGLFGERGTSVADELRRARLSYKLAIYHRDRLAPVGDGGLA